jgi:hypothetical protein
MATERVRDAEQKPGKSFRTRREKDENPGGGFSSPAAQKMRRNSRKAKDHEVDGTPYLPGRPQDLVRQLPTEVAQSPWGSPRPSRTASLAPRSGLGRSHRGRGSVARTAVGARSLAPRSGLGRSLAPRSGLGRSHRGRGSVARTAVGARSLAPRSGLQDARTAVGTRY